MARTAEKGPRGEKAVWPAGTGHAGRQVLPGFESLCHFLALCPEHTRSGTCEDRRVTLVWGWGQGNLPLEVSDVCCSSWEMGVL